MSNKQKYNFGEKLKEKIKDGQGWVELEVWKTPKYLEAKKKAIELIEKTEYNLQESDFWILMNKGNKKMCYSGLIISHNGCLKINDTLPSEDKFKPSCATVYKDCNDEIVMQYINDEQGIFEFGEVSNKTLKNEYKYAMVLKRLMDRVILKNSKIAFNGIYSEVESDEFKRNNDESKEDNKKQSKIDFEEVKQKLLDSKTIDDLRVAFNDYSSNKDSFSDEQLKELNLVKDSMKNELEKM